MTFDTPPRAAVSYTFRPASTVSFLLAGWGD